MKPDSHARYLELTIEGIRVVNIYLPNGNPVGTEKFAYKLAWMDRLIKQMSAWREQESAGGGWRRLQCHSGGHRLPQAFLLDPRRAVPARAAGTLSGAAQSRLYRRVPFAPS